MKKVLFCIILALSFNSVFAEKIADNSKEFRITSFNIRNNKSLDGLDAWISRRPKTIEAIRYIDPDIMGIQEGFNSQLKYLGKNLPEYDYVGEGRGGGIRDEHCTIFYKKTKFKLIETQTLWLSDTPEKKSKTWDHFHYRIITRADFETKDGFKFSVINTHFDHESEKARVNSAIMISQIMEKSELPTIVMGDINATPDSEAIRILTDKSEDRANVLSDAFYLAEVEDPDISENGTFHGFKGEARFPRIDYILLTKEFTATKAAVVRDKFSGRHPSDHFPIYADIKILK